jgi:hypothetical protein
MSTCQELLSAENEFSSIWYAALPFVTKKFSFFVFTWFFPVFPSNKIKIKIFKKVLDKSTLHVYNKPRR